jgi:hypothetical protein
MEYAAAAMDAPLARRLPAELLGAGHGRIRARCPDLSPADAAEVIAA